MSKLINTSPATVVPAEVSKDFEHARKLKRTIQGALIGTAAAMTLWGFEIERLQKKWGDGRGGDRKSTDFKTRKRAGFEIPTWEALLKAELDISADTAERYKALAKGARKRSEVLQEIHEKLLTTPFDQLPLKLQEKAITATNNIMPGKSGQEAMRDFGIARKEKGSFSKQHKGGNSTKSKTTPEEDAQAVFKHLLKAIADVTDPWHTFELRLYAMPLDCTEAESEAGRIGLTDLDASLSAMLEHVQKARISIGKHSRKSAAHDPKARLTEAQAKAHAEVKKPRS